jgi:hypothetical protein
MKTTYYSADDILEIPFSNKPVSGEVSHGWNPNFSYASDGSAVEIVLLEAKEKGLYPIELDRAVV